MFVSYSRTHKDYRCYDPLHIKYRLSTDVTFFEPVSFWTPIAPNVPIPLPLNASQVDTPSVAPKDKPLQVYTRDEKK